MKTALLFGKSIVFYFVSKETVQFQNLLIKEIPMVTEANGTEIEVMFILLRRFIKFTRDKCISL